MKQPSNPEFAQASRDALITARQLKDVPRIVEAVNRASMLIALSPEKAEDILREKMNEGVKL